MRLCSGRSWQMSDRERIALSLTKNEQFAQKNLNKIGSFLNRLRIRIRNTGLLYIREKHRTSNSIIFAEWWLTLRCDAHRGVWIFHAAKSFIVFWTPRKPRNFRFRISSRIRNYSKTGRGTWQEVKESGGRCEVYSYTCNISNTVEFLLLFLFVMYIVH